jgi:hypothetical protein
VRENLTGGVDSTHPTWRLTPFVDFPGAYGATAYRFEWEREWRVPAGLAFGPDDVAFLFIPEGLHAAARTFFEGHLADPFRPGVSLPLCRPELGHAADPGGVRGGRMLASRRGERGCFGSLRHVRLLRRPDLRRNACSAESSRLTKRDCGASFGERCICGRCWLHPATSRSRIQVAA